MAYATLQDLIDRAGADELAQVADRDRDGIVDQTVVDAAIDAAAVEIDARLGVRFRLPLDPVPEIVKSWAVSLARYTLHRDGAPDHVVRDQRDALTALDRAAAGKIALPGAVDQTVTTPAITGGGIGVVSDEPRLDRTALSGWL